MCGKMTLYLLATAACLATCCYERLVVNAGGLFPNALLAAVLPVTALQLVKTAESA